MTALPNLVGADELGAQLGVGKRAVYRWHEEKGLPAYKVGTRLLFDPPAVVAWLEALKVGSWNGASP